MDSVHRHGHGERGTVHSKTTDFCTAIALQLMHLVQGRFQVHCIFFYPSTPAFVYIASLSLYVYIK